MSHVPRHMRVEYTLVGLRFLSLGRTCLDASIALNLTLLISAAFVVFTRSLLHRTGWEQKQRGKGSRDLPKARKFSWEPPHGCHVSFSSSRVGPRDRRRFRSISSRWQQQAIKPPAECLGTFTRIMTFSYNRRKKSTKDRCLIWLAKIRCKS